jgi:hypothetical protein
MRSFVIAIIVALLIFAPHTQAATIQIGTITPPPNIRATLMQEVHSGTMEGRTFADLIFFFTAGGSYGGFEPYPLNIAQQLVAGHFEQMFPLADSHGNSIGGGSVLVKLVSDPIPVLMPGQSASRDFTMTGVLTLPPSAGVTIIDLVGRGSFTFGKDPQGPHFGESFFHADFVSPEPSTAILAIFGALALPFHFLKHHIH